MLARSSEHGIRLLRARDLHVKDDFRVIRTLTWPGGLRMLETPISYIVDGRWSGWGWPKLHYAVAWQLITLESRGIYGVSHLTLAREAVF